MRLLIIAALIAITFIIPFYVVYDDNIIAERLTEKHIRWSIAASMVSIPSVFINFLVLLYIARGSSSINQTALEVASSMSDAAKGVEFSYLLPLVSKELNNFIEKIRCMYESEVREGNKQNDAKILYYVSKNPSDTMVLYTRIINEYKEVYDKFENEIKNHVNLVNILGASDVGKYRQMIRDFDL